MLPSIPPEAAQKVSLWVGVVVATILTILFASLALLAFFDWGIAPWLGLPPMGLGNALAVVGIYGIFLVVTVLLKDKDGGK